MHTCVHVAYMYVILHVQLEGFKPAAKDPCLALFANVCDTCTFCIDMHLLGIYLLLFIIFF